MTAIAKKLQATPMAPYFNLLQGILDETRDEIEKPRLSKEERKRGLMSLAGCWKDNPEDAARMESAIKEGRKNEFMREINLDD